MSNSLTPNRINHQTIDNWVFDLDNTLYHHSFNLFSQVDKLMTKFVMEKLSLPFDDARTLQKNYFFHYGTTLRGLMENHDIDPTEFLRNVHDIDYTVLPRNEILAQHLQKLPGDKYIFTNGDTDHAHQTLNQLGIASNIFTKIVSIKDTNYIPKPQHVAYESFFAQCPKIVKERSVLIDDIADNLKTAKSFAMQTIWLRVDSHPNNPPSLPHLATATPHYIDAVIDDITPFLASIVNM